MKKLILAVTAFALVTSAQTAKSVTGSFTDKRDGKTYRIVKIGTQTWMAENLNYKMVDGRCYGENGKIPKPVECCKHIITTITSEEVQANCQKYGRLYDWNVAIKACPAGWHLPSDEEWTVLEKYVGGKDVAGKKPKSTTGWLLKGNGNDDYGFSALSSGHGDFDDNFYDVGKSAVWWSATEDSAGDAWYRQMDYLEEYVGKYTTVKASLFSVRCVQD